MSAEFERLVAQFEQFQSKIKRVDDQLANVGQMQSEIATIEATATNADRSVTVVAGPGGAIKDIRLTERALAQQPQALSSDLISTIQQAVGEAARKQAGVVDDHMGGELNVTDQVIETQAELFGTSPQELRERMDQERPARRQAPPEEEYHEDYSHQDIFAADAEQPPSTPPPADDGGSAGDEFLQNLFGDDDRR